jgi:HPt (histidine-containing phosphotransfer) domain-containing protein
MQGDRERCLQAGMDDYVAKPVKRDSLTAALLRWLTEPSWRGELQMERASGTSPERMLDMSALKQLIELFDGDATDVIESYVSDSATQLDVMTNALNEGDDAALARAAHSLKSSSRSLGALVVGNLAEQIEMSARTAASSGAVKALLPQLRRALSQVEPLLKAELGPNGRRASA